MSEIAISTGYANKQYHYIAEARTEVSHYFFFPRALTDNRPYLQGLPSGLLPRI